MSQFVLMFLFFVSATTAVVGLIAPLAIRKPAITYGPYLNPQSKKSLVELFGLISIGVFVTLAWAYSQGILLVGALAAVIGLLYALSIIFQYPNVQCWFSGSVGHKTYNFLSYTSATVYFVTIVYVALTAIHILFIL